MLRREKTASSIRATLLLASALVYLVCLGGSAQGQQWAKKMFSETRHDFGVVARGAKAEHRFVLHNLYVEDVHIAGVRSSCGCTSVWIEKPHLKTHEEGAIVAHVNSDRFLGQKGATITVTIDKPYPAEVRLQVKSYIRSDVVFTPGSVEMGTVPAGTDVERSVDLQYHGGSSWRVTGVKSTNPHIRCEAVPTRSRGGQVGYRLHVTIDGDMPPGYVNEQLIVETNDSYRTQIPLVIEGVVQAPEVMISPSPLRLGVVEPGERVTKTLVIRGPAPFRIRSIESKDGLFQFGEIDPTPKSLHVIPVTFMAEALAGKIDDTLHIETDLDSQDIAASVTVTQDNPVGHL